MRPIDADKIPITETWALVNSDNKSSEGISFAPLRCVLKKDIDNAPTVEIPTELCKGCRFLKDCETCEEKLRPQGEWIPVSERLPEDMHRVLIWYEYYRYGDYNCMYQTYGFGYVCDGQWSSFINGESGWQDARIIAWMPLPEPYKEAENE